MKKFLFLSLLGLPVLFLGGCSLINKNNFCTNSGYLEKIYQLENQLSGLVEFFSGLQVENKILKEILSGSIDTLELFKKENETLQIQESKINDNIGKQYQSMSKDYACKQVNGFYNSYLEINRDDNGYVYSFFKEGNKLHYIVSENIHDSYKKSYLYQYECNTKTTKLLDKNFGKNFKIEGWINNEGLIIYGIIEIKYVEGNTYIIGIYAGEGGGGIADIRYYDILTKQKENIDRRKFEGFEELRNKFGNKNMSKEYAAGRIIDFIPDSLYKGNIYFNPNYWEDKPNTTKHIVNIKQKKIHIIENTNK